MARLHFRCFQTLKDKEGVDNDPATGIGLTARPTTFRNHAYYAYLYWVDTRAVSVRTALGIFDTMAR